MKCGGKTSQTKVVQSCKGLLLSEYLPKNGFESATVAERSKTKRNWYIIQCRLVKAVSLWAVA